LVVSTSSSPVTKHQEAKSTIMFGRVCKSLEFCRCIKNAQAKADDDGKGKEKGLGDVCHGSKWNWNTKTSESFSLLKKSFMLKTNVTLEKTIIRSVIFGQLDPQRQITQDRETGSCQ